MSARKSWWNAGMQTFCMMLPYMYFIGDFRARDFSAGSSSSVQFTVADGCEAARAVQRMLAQKVINANFFQLQRCFFIPELWAVCVSLCYVMYMI